LLSDAFNFAIFISLKLKVKDENTLSFQTLMEKDYSMTLELICFASNIKKEVCIVLNYFLSFLKKYEEKRTHNMLSLMLDLRFENLHLISFFIGHEQGVAIVEEYDERSLYLMFLKCYHHLQLVVGSEN
jgi:hypothetical protein